MSSGGVWNNWQWLNGHVNFKLMFCNSRLQQQQQRKPSEHFKRKAYDKGRAEKQARLQFLHCSVNTVIYVFPTYWWCKFSQFKPVNCRHGRRANSETCCSCLFNTALDFLSGRLIQNSRCSPYASPAGLQTRSNWLQPHGYMWLHLFIGILCLWLF